MKAPTLLIKVLIGPFLVLLTAAPAGAQDKIMPGHAEDTLQHGSFRLGFGLGSPVLTRSRFIMPAYPTDIRTTETWQNAYTDLGDFPFAFLGEVSHDRPSGISFTVGGSYRPIHFRDNFYFYAEKTFISATSCYAKVLVQPCWLRLDNSICMNWSANPWSVQGVFGGLVQQEWFAMDGSGNISYRYSYKQRDRITSLCGVVGLYLGDARFAFGLETELLVASYIHDHWWRSFYAYNDPGPIRDGTNSHWIDLSEAIERHCFLHSITLRATWRLGKHHT